MKDVLKEGCCLRRYKVGGNKGYCLVTELQKCQRSVLSEELRICDLDRSSFEIL